MKSRFSETPNKIRTLWDNQKDLEIRRLALKKERELSNTNNKLIRINNNYVYDSGYVNLEVDTTVPTEIKYYHTWNVNLGNIHSSFYDNIMIQLINDTPEELKEDTKYTTNYSSSITGNVLTVVSEVVQMVEVGGTSHTPEETLVWLQSQIVHFRGRPRSELVYCSIVNLEYGGFCHIALPGTLYLQIGVYATWWGAYSSLTPLYSYNTVVGGYPLTIGVYNFAIITPPDDRFENVSLRATFELVDTTGAGGGYVLDYYGGNLIMGPPIDNPIYNVRQKLLISISNKGKNEIRRNA